MHHEARASPPHFLPPFSLLSSHGLLFLSSVLGSGTLPPGLHLSCPQAWTLPPAVLPLLLTPPLLRDSLPLASSLSHFSVLLSSGTCLPESLEKAPIGLLSSCLGGKDSFSTG